MDEKAKLMMKHYSQIVENRLFDEYDILGFLVFVRDYLKEKGNYPYICDYGDFVAHRNRCKGKVMDAIIASIDNQYIVDSATKQVNGYNGMVYNLLVEEWNKLAVEFFQYLR